MHHSFARPLWQEQPGAALQSSEHQTRSHTLSAKSKEAITTEPGYRVPNSKGFHGERQLRDTAHRRRINDPLLNRCGPADSGVSTRSTTPKGSTIISKMTIADDFTTSHQLSPSCPHKDDAWGCAMEASQISPVLSPCAMTRAHQSLPVVLTDQHPRSGDTPAADPSASANASRGLSNTPNKRLSDDRYHGHHCGKASWADASRLGGTHRESSCSSGFLPSVRQPTDGCAASNQQCDEHTSPADGLPLASQLGAASSSDPPLKKYSLPSQDLSEVQPPDAVYRTSTGTSPTETGTEVLSPCSRPSRCQPSRAGRGFSTTGASQCVSWHRDADGVRPTMATTAGSLKTTAALGRRALSADRVILSGRDRQDTERKPNNFRLAREVGKTICVCGASAYWERERIALGTERIRLTQESERLRCELSAIRETRQRIHSRLLDLEDLENRISSRTEVVTAREAAADEEASRLAVLSTELKANRAELERRSDDLTQRERDFEIVRRKHDKEAMEIREQASFNASEARRLRDLSLRLTQKKAELLSTEEELHSMKQQCYGVRDELQRDKSVLETQQQELFELAQNLSGEKTRLQRWEQELQDRAQQLALRENELDASRTRFLEERERFDKELTGMDTKRHELDSREAELEAATEALTLERTEFEKKRASELDAWTKQVTKERESLQETAEAFERRKRGCEETRAALEAFERDLSLRESRLTALEESLDERGKSLMETEQLQQERMAELDRQKSALEKDRVALTAERTELEKQQARLSAQLNAVLKDKNHVTTELESFSVRESQLTDIENQLKEREAELTKREAVLLSKEARSRWHQEVMKDIVDMKDRYELQLQDLELEKRSFAEMKADVLAAQDRAAAALRLREQSLASLEVSMRAKQVELARREKLLGSGVSTATKPKALTARPHASPPSHPRRGGSKLDAICSSVPRSYSSNTRDQSRGLNEFPSLHDGRQLGSDEVHENRFGRQPQNAVTTRHPGSSTSLRMSSFVRSASAGSYRPLSRAVSSREQSITRSSTSIHCSTGRSDGIASRENRPLDGSKAPDAIAHTSNKPDTAVPTDSRADEAPHAGCPSHRSLLSSCSAATVLESPAFPLHLSPYAQTMGSNLGEKLPFHQGIMHNDDIATDPPSALADIANLEELEDASTDIRPPRLLGRTASSSDAHIDETSRRLQEDPDLSYDHHALHSTATLPPNHLHSPPFKAGDVFLEQQQLHQSPGFPIRTFESLMAKDQMTHFNPSRPPKPLDVSSASIIDSPILAVRPI